MRFVVKLFGILPVLVIDGTWEYEDEVVEDHPFFQSVIELFVYVERYPT